MKNPKQRLVRRFLIQSGTFQQAIDYAMENNLAPTEWVYLNRPEKARGLRGIGLKVIKTGTYWENRFEREIDSVVLGQELEYA